MRPDPTFDLKTYLGVLRRRIWLLLIPVVLLTGIVGAGSLFLPDVYRTSALLLIKPEKDPVRGLAVQGDMARDVEGILFELDRYEEQQKVIQQLSKDMPQGLSEQAALRDIKNHLRLRRGKQGRDILVMVDYQGSPKEYAIAVVNTFAEEVQRRAAEVIEETILTSEESIGVMLQDFAKERADLKKSEREVMDELQRELGDLAPRSAIEGLDNFVVQRMAANNAELQRLDLLIGGLEARDEMLRRYMAQTSPTMQLQDRSDAVGQAIANVQQMIATAKMNRVSMELRYTEEHPALRELDNQVQELEGYLHELEAKAETITTSRPNPQYAMASEELIRVQTELDAVRAARAKVEARAARMREFYGRVPYLEEKLNQVKQRREALNSATEQLQKRLDNINLSKRYEDQNTQRFEMQRAVPFLLEPAAPNRKKVALLGFGAGLLIGLSFVLLAEYLDHAVRTEQDLRRYVDAPLLAVLPRTPQ